MRDKDDVTTTTFYVVRNKFVCLFVCLFCFVLFCFVLFCFVLFCFVCLFVCLLVCFFLFVLFIGSGLGRSSFVCFGFVRFILHRGQCYKTPFAVAFLDFCLCVSLAGARKKTLQVLRKYF